MNHCISLFLLLIPSLIAFGLLGVAFSTKWWMIPLEKNIPDEHSLNMTDDIRLYSMLIPITMSRGLLTECVAYRNIKILVSNSFDFRKEILREHELKSSYRNCSNDQFTCETSTTISQPFTRCIDQGKQCDRIIDCEDKSDELSCDSNFQVTNCPPGYAECPDGKSCYRKEEQTCDGVSNCMDNSDEKDCDEAKCQLHKHVFCSREEKCARRENSYRCDGIVDCEDNSDEENCEQCDGNSNAFLCDSKCFLLKHRCDNIVHCSDFYDELNCGDYNNISYVQRNSHHNGRFCEEKRLNPFKIHLPSIDSSLLELYPNPKQRLLLFACTWIWKKEILLDYEKNLPFDIMIHQRNPSLKDLEYFGLSFWLACGAALTTFLGLLLSCCFCCKIGSSRSENKEYEIMQMHSY
ncbi:unnamed protein product [Rotaria magnacalcarata]|uniref:Uncharacterized protein n=1 Tax=Rotaria magnacalcarata TaxID=392030 RepID=A0A818XCG2_9BILA|nr:unnamed protein product [Rotaria magnacalcarata]CAF2122430.1 unnamed protein product [Rotaria magnacalcarata]CAF3738538.1 unnamed protein product [Rotaria magnacalcarata]CAF3775000.1 unnamed protein product [Rotaria magnacalcarata]